MLHVPPRELTIHGATLTVSTLNGWSVSAHGRYIGYLHASIGSQFNAYLRHPDRDDEWITRTDLHDGVRRILLAAGETAEEAA